ncbi:hypothetical protein I4U23_003682 [Adineta vaga]|nr:hypothetical protein I4U23_003682 [Adineta vaga]
MQSSMFLSTVTLLLIQFVYNVYADDRPIIIGSSVGGVLVSIILILDLIAIFELLRSSGRGACSKLIWILIIFFFPIGDIEIARQLGSNKQKFGYIRSKKLITGRKLDVKLTTVKTTTATLVTTNTTTVISGSPNGITTGDFNDDSKMDIATANAGSSTAQIFFNPS